MNPERTNRLGQPVGYALVPQGQPLLLAADEASIRRRARVRHPPPVGDPVRPGGALLGR